MAWPSGIASCCALRQRADVIISVVPNSQSGRIHQMALYVLSYDLRKPDMDYQPLYDKLHSVGAKHIQESVWSFHDPENNTDPPNSLRRMFGGSVLFSGSWNDQT